MIGYDWSLGIRMDYLYFLSILRSAKQTRKEEADVLKNFYVKFFFYLAAIMLFSFPF